MGKRSPPRAAPGFVYRQLARDLDLQFSYSLRSVGARLRDVSGAVAARLTIEAGGDG